MVGRLGKETTSTPLVCVQWLGGKSVELRFNSQLESYDSFFLSSQNVAKGMQNLKMCLPFRCNKRTGRYGPEEDKYLSSLFPLARWSILTRSVCMRSTRRSWKRKASVLFLLMGMESNKLGDEETPGRDPAGTQKQHLLKLQVIVEG